MTTYSFVERMKAGHQGEAHLDEFFSRWYEITPANREEQRLGFDRWYAAKKSSADPAGGRSYYRVEYKTDETAGRTNNAFVETVSVDTDNVPGWAIKSEADILIYYIPDPGTIYVIRMADLRKWLTRWSTLYEERTIPNEGYNTIGLLVPLTEFERIALQVY